MKKIRVFVRAKQIFDGSFIGIYGMEYKKVIKNTMIHDLDESNNGRAELRLLIEAVKSCKEPCDITVYSLFKIFAKVGQDLITIYDDDDLISELKEELEKGGHKINLVIQSDEDPKKIRILFQEYKKMLDSMKLGGEGE